MLYTVFRVVALPQALVKTLVKNMVKNLGRSLTGGEGQLTNEIAQPWKVHNLANKQTSYLAHWNFPGTPAN